MPIPEWNRKNRKVEPYLEALGLLHWPVTLL